MSDTGLSLKSADFNTYALEMKAEKEDQLSKWMDKNLQQGYDKDWEYSHVIWKKPAPEDKRDWSAQLLDPGTAKIMGFMGVRPRHIDTVVEAEKETGHVRAQMKVELVTILPILYYEPYSKKVIEVYPIIAEGVGSCTTKEKRFKVKWENYTGKGLIAQGFTKADLEKILKDNPERVVRENEDILKTIFYMPDPEAAGADNSLLKMAAKRSESDAVFQIPGVAQRFSQELDITETEINAEGDRVPKPAEEAPAKSEPTAAAETDEATDKLIQNILYEYPEYTADELVSQAHQIMDKSDGLYTTVETALKVLWKRLKQREEVAEKIAEPLPNTPKPESKTPAAAKPDEKAVPPSKDAPAESITSKDGTMLGKLVVEGTDARFTPSLDFTVDMPPFQSFLVDRVLQGMADADAERVKNGEITEGMEYDITEDNYRIACIDIYRYGGERRLNEIKSSIRWTFDKMYDKVKEAPEETAEPSFKTAGGETVMCAEEVKARAAVDGLTGSDQLDYVVDGNVLKITPKRFLDDAWNGIKDALMPLGGSWVKVKPNHWEIPVKAAKVWPKVVGLESAEVEETISRIQAANPKVSKAAVLEKVDAEVAKAAGLLTKEAAAHLVASEYLSDPEKPTGLSIESVEAYLSKAHGDLANQRLAVTENSTFIMVEPYQSLTPTEKASFDKSMKGLGAEYRGDDAGWFIKKPKK